MQHADLWVEEDFAHHVAGSARDVVLAIAVSEEGEEEFAVFSSLAGAKAWADSRSAGEGGALFFCKIIDEPDYGNVPADRQQ